MDKIYVIKDKKKQIAAICDNDEDIVRFLLVHADYFAFPKNKTVEEWLDVFGDGYGPEDFNGVMLYGEVVPYNVDMDYLYTGDLKSDTKNFGYDIDENFARYLAESEKSSPDIV